MIRGHVVKGCKDREGDGPPPIFLADVDVSQDKLYLAILDYHLPGDDGYQLFQELRSLNTGVRVLMASGFLASGEVARLQQGGVQGIIYKPFRLAELQQSIRGALAAGPCH